jgi:hypothetical protein
MPTKVAVSEIVEPGAAQPFIVEGEADSADQVQRCADGDARSGDVAGVERDVGLEQTDA